MFRNVDNKTVVVSARVAGEKMDLLHVVRKRWGAKYVSDVVEAAIDRLLISEGLMKDAA
jgi:hypothetical protein